MFKLKTSVAWMLVVAATAASAIGGYQYFAPAKAAAPNASAVLVPQPPPPAAPVKSGALAYISASLRREIESLAPGATTGVFVHFTPETLENRLTILARFPLTIVNDFYPEADAVFVSGTAEALLAVAAEPGVYYLEQNEKLHYNNHTANWAIRTRMTQERVGFGPYLDAQGRILEGVGIGVAVVDSGVDGTHGDFDTALNGGRNYKIVCPPVNLDPSCTDNQFVDVGTTGTSDTTSGHGHHVSGTVLGDGANSLVNYPDAAGTPYIKGSFSGVAQKAKLYAYGTGEAIAVFFAAQSYQHMLRNFDNRTVFPTPIRVTNNSYGNTGGTAYSATNVLSQLVKRIVVEKNVVVVFAAGNDGDATANDTTSGYCKDPTPGVICVASYSDLDTGSLQGVMSGFTSQGALASPANYPDIAAPGDTITSTCTAALPICKDTTGGDTAFLPLYGTIGGTSMASPHVAGAVALLLQARPDLTAAQVENILQDHARKVVDNVYGPERAAYTSDPQNTGTSGADGSYPSDQAATINYRAGAGLLDLPAALDTLISQDIAAGTAPRITKQASLPANVETTVISGDANATGGADNGSQNAVGAKDFTQLTAIYENLGGTTGIRWRFTVANAANLDGASYVRYRVIANVDGKGTSSSGTLTAQGFAADPRSAINNAVATNATMTGNVLSLFVPLVSLGSPPVGAPVHNIQVQVTSDVDGAETEVDYAPSRTPDSDTLSSAPGFGKPLTVLLAALSEGGVATENICAVPGLTILTDGGSDSLAPSGAVEIQGLNISQPFLAGADRVFFTLKVADLSTLPAATTWPVRFCAPGFPCVNPGAAVSASNRFYTVRMTTDSSVAVGASPATPIFQLVSPTGTGTATAATTALPASNYTTSGRVTIAVNAADLGFTAENRTVQQFLSRVQAGAATPDNMPDSLTGSGSYVAKPSAFCAPTTLPIAVLAATPNNGNKPLEVAFTGAGSTESDAGDSIVEYTFDFGDGSAFKVQTSPTVSHTYTKGGSYTAKLKVKDSRGGESTSLGMAAVTVVNNAPTAVLNSDKANGVAPLTVAFDALPSSDPNGGDSVVSYSFDLDGDGTFEIVDGDSAKPSFTYNTAGSYTAKVKVKDSEGLESAVASKTITATNAATPANTAPTARLTADKTSGTAPLVVVFDASASSDADAGDAVASYSFDLDGNGTFELVDVSNAKPSFTYNTAGTYAAKVKVKDQSGLESTAVTRTIVVNAAGATSNNRAPVAAMLAPVTSGAAPLGIEFNASGSSDPDAGDYPASFRFDFGDGTPVQSGPNKVAYHSFSAPGDYVVSLVVTDSHGAMSAPKTTQVKVLPATAAAAPNGPSTSIVQQGGSGAVDPRLLLGLGLLLMGRWRRRR